LLQKEVKKLKSEKKKLKKMVEKIKKGTIPQTGAGNRGTPSSNRSRSSNEGDALDKFFSRY
jgi:hypothetical protein